MFLRSIYKKSWLCFALMVSLIVLVFGAGVTCAADKEKEAGSPAELKTIKSMAVPKNGNIQMSGNLYYQIDEYNRLMTIAVERIFNNNAGGISGTLKLFLYASSDYYSGGTLTGYSLGGFTLGTLAAQYSIDNIDRQLQYYPPPYGAYWIVLILTEQIASGEDLIIDWYVFASQEVIGYSGEGEAASGGGGGCFLDSIRKSSNASPKFSQTGRYENPVK